MVPTISIVMPVYNREHYLKEAIESVLAQTRRDFELLVWDDGSTDNSVALARHYEQCDRRVRVITASHQGQTKSLIAAIAATTGAYVGWVDSDDFIAPTALFETATVLEQEPEVGLVYTDYLVIDEHSSVKGLGQRCRIPYSKDRLLVDFMIFHFRLFRRSVYNLVGGLDESMVRAQDYDLCLRLSEVTQISHIQKPLYYYRQHKSSVSQQQRVEQILAAEQAIVRALERRGLSERYELEVEIVGRYLLRQKAAFKR